MCVHQCDNDATDKLLQMSVYVDFYTSLVVIVLLNTRSTFDSIDIQSITTTCLVKSVSSFLRSSAKFEENFQ